MTTKITITGEITLFGIPLDLVGELDGDESRFEANLTETYSVANIIDGFAGLVVPGFAVTAPAPWDGLLELELSPLTLWMQGTRVGFTMHQNLDLAGIVTITKLGLWYDNAADADIQVGVSLEGLLLGTPFDEVNWNPIAEPTPAIDAGGKPFELIYLGAGQRMRLVEQPKTMDGVIAALIDAKGDSDLVEYSPDAGWLFGTRFSALDTVDVDLAIVDPELYGLVIRFRGERAKVLAGLRFEILYRKISDELGVYHADLELPNSIRHFELGVASITLPAIVVDIYTDGSFLIDIGFPHNLDFSRSMAIEVFPYVGVGGFYVGKLPAEAVPSLPEPAEGFEFGSVMAFGVGVSLGLGKTIEAGVLSAGMTVSLIGVLEGLVAGYGEERSEPSALYYRASGHVALVGHLYGSVNFGIIRAQVDVLAYASATVVFEAHQATSVVLEAGVSVRLQVKILFVTINFSFDAVIREEFIIGSETTAPWLGRGGPMLASGPTRQALARTSDLQRPVQPFLITPDKVMNGPPVEVHLKFAPQVTVATDPDGNLGVALVNMLFIEMPNAEAEPGSTMDTSFGRVYEACFRWAASIVTGGHDDYTELGPDALRNLQRQLGEFFVEDEQDQLLSVSTVLDFWTLNFSWYLEPWPDTEPPAAATVFPMMTGNRLNIEGPGAPPLVDFDEQKLCSPEYQRFLGSYFDRLSVIIGEETETSDQEVRDRQAPSLPGLVMVDYFRTVLRSAIADSLENFDLLPFATGLGTTLGSLADSFGHASIFDMALADEPDADPPPDPDAEPDVDAEPDRRVEGLIVPAGGSTPVPEEPTTLHELPAELGSSVDEDNPFDGSAIATANLDTQGLLQPDVLVQWPPGEPAEPADGQQVVYTTAEGDTLASVLARLHEQRIGQTSITAIELIDCHPALLSPGAALLLPTFVVLPEPGQTLATIGGAFSLLPDVILTANADAPVQGVLRIPNCPSLTVGQHLRAIELEHGVAKAGAGAARYMLHGLRLPDPDLFDPADHSTGESTGESADQLLRPLYELTGQQMMLTQEQWDQIGSWTFYLGDRNMARITPAMDDLVATAQEYLAALAADPDALVAGLGARFASVGQAPPYIVEPLLLPLNPPITWRRSDGEEPGQSHLVPLSGPVRSRIDSPLSLDVLSGGDSAALAGVRWATVIDVTVRQVVEPGQRSGYLEDLYEVATSDQAGRATLLEAIDALAEPRGAGAQLLITYAGPEGGLTTDQLSPATAIVQTNLSTFTRPPDARDTVGDEERDPEPEIEPPTVANPRAFLEVLWKAVVTNRGGYYLRYLLDGDSTLDTLFGRGGQAVLSFVVLWADGPVGSVVNAVEVSDGADGDAAERAYSVRATTGIVPAPSIDETVAALAIGRAEFAAANATNPDLLLHASLVNEHYHVRAGDTLASVAMALDLTVEKLVEVAGPQPILVVGAPVLLRRRWTGRHATVPQGSIGLRATRIPGPDVTPAIEALAESNHLLGFAVRSNESFDGSDAGLAMGPTGSADDPEQALTYRRIIPLSRLASDGAPTDPYAGIGQTASIEFAPVDLYGNQHRPAHETSVELGYRDPLLGVEQWPGLSVGYHVVGQTLCVALSLDPSRLIPSTTRPFLAMSRRIATDRDQWDLIDQQTMRDRVTGDLRWSLDPSQTYPVDIAELRVMSDAARSWTTTAALIEPLVVSSTAKQRTLVDLGDAYRVAGLDVATVNADNPTLLKVGADVVLPNGEETRIVTGDTLAGIAARHRITVQELAELNLDRDLVGGRATVEVPLHYVIGDGAEADNLHTINTRESLCDIADTYGVSIERLTLANLTLDAILTVPKSGSRLTYLGDQDSGADTKDVTLKTKIHQGDTLATVLARVRVEIGGEVDLATFVTKNSGLRTGGLRPKKSARLLIPPRDHLISIPVTATSTETVTDLTVQLSIERPASLVDPLFTDAPGVWRTTTELRPDMSEATGSTSSADSTGSDFDEMRRFAETLEIAFPPWKLARESVPTFGDFHSDQLAAVRLDTSEITTVGSFCHYAVPPILTTPWLDPGPTDDSEPVVRAAVDLDLLNKDFLAAVESLLAPIRGPILREISDGSWQRLLAVKQQLADAISRTTLPVLVTAGARDGDDSGRRAAIETVKQQLLYRLTTLDQQATIVDREVALPDDWPHDVRLYGKAAGETVAAGAEVKLGRTATDSTSSISAWFVNRTEQTWVDDDLRFEPTGCEYAVSTRPNGYDVSRWVTFVRPVEPVTVGQTTIPFPRRYQPQPPVAVSDRVDFRATGDSRVANLRRYAYGLDYDFLQVAGDEAVVELRVNNDPDVLTTPGQEVDRLARALLAFTDARAEQPVIEALAAQENIEEAFTAFVDLASEVAEAWQDIQPAPLTIPGLESGDEPLDEPRLGSTQDADRTASQRKLFGGLGKTFTSVELSTIETQQIAGRVSVRRNHQLVPTGERTVPAFVIQTDEVGLRAARQPHQRHDVEIDGLSFALAGDADGGLGWRLSAIFQALTGLTNSSSGTPPIDIEVLANLEIGGGVPIIAPIGLWRRRQIGSSADLEPDQPFVAEMIEPLLAPASDVSADSRWILNVKIYPTASATNAPPLLEASRIVIPTAAVSRSS